MTYSIQDVQSRTELAKCNVKRMQDIMNVSDKSRIIVSEFNNLATSPCNSYFGMPLQEWIVTPMFERKDNKIDSLLDLEGRCVALQKKYNSITESGEKIHALITVLNYRIYKKIQNILRLSKC